MDIEARSYPFARPRPFEPPEEFAWLRANRPVAKVTLESGDPAWVVTRYEDVRSVLTDRRFGRSINQEGASRVDTGFEAEADSPVFNFGGSISEPPGHTRWRRMVNQAFTARQAESMRAGIAGHAESLLDELAGRGGGFDLVADYAYKLPIRVICDLLGIEDAARPEFIALAAQITRRDMQSSFVEFGQALQDIGRYAVGLIVRKRKHLADDLLSTLIGLRDEEDGGLTNEELVSTVILLLMAGYESTAVQLGNAFYALLRNPGQMERLRNEPELVTGAVEEVLRYAQMGTGYAIAKFTAEDVELAGEKIPAGSVVFVSLASANHDERIFGEDADRLDLERTDAVRQMAFGHGPHFCLGAALARAEMQEGISRMLARFPRLTFAGDDLDRVPLASNLFTFYPSELRVRT